MAVRSQQLSATLKGGHSMMARWGGSREELMGRGRMKRGSTSGKRCWEKERVWKGDMGAKETTRANVDPGLQISPSDARVSLSSASRGFPQHFPSTLARNCKNDSGAKRPSAANPLFSVKEKNHGFLFWSQISGVITFFPWSTCTSTWLAELGNKVHCVLIRKESVTMKLLNKPWFYS